MAQMCYRLSSAFLDPCFNRSNQIPSPKIGELGMIIAASPDVLVVNAEDVPAELLAKERDVEMGKEDIKSKPEAVRAKIVEGRIEKIKNQMALVNQVRPRSPPILLIHPLTQPPFSTPPLLHHSSFLLRCRMSLTLFSQANMPLSIPPLSLRPR